MNTSWIRSLILPGLLLATSARTQANDLVDLLRAMNGGSQPHHRQPGGQTNAGRPVGPQFSGSPYGPGNRVGEYRPDGRRTGDHDHLHGDHREFGSGRNHATSVGMERVDLRHRMAARPGAPRQWPSAGGRPVNGGQLIIRVGAGANGYNGYNEPLYIPAQDPGQSLPPAYDMPQLPVPPSPPVWNTQPGYSTGPLPSGGYVGPCEVGQFVDCGMPLSTGVFVEDACNIAPNAIPMVIAVRAPQPCHHHCLDRIVFVQVMVPPCPIQGLTVSPCQTRLSLDYGRYEIDVKTCDDHIVVDYDN